MPELTWNQTARRFEPGNRPGRPIRVEFINPPIPYRGHDFCATFDDYDGPGSPHGLGETPAGAVKSLLECDL